MKTTQISVEVRGLCNQTPSLPSTQTGRVKVTFWRATPVWLSIRPFMVAPVFSVTLVAASNTPCTFALDPISTAPATTQTILRGRAPPVRIIFTPGAAVRVPATWKIQAREGQGQPVLMISELKCVLSRLLPEMVILVDRSTPEVHL